MRQVSKAYIIHLFTVCGGIERVSLEIARALRNRGVSVTYLTNSGRILNKCRELFNIDVEYDVMEIRSYLEQLLGVTGRFVRVRSMLMLSKIYSVFNGLRDLKMSGLTIDTKTNHPSGVHVSYIHYPALLGTAYGGSEKTLHWRAYGWLVRQLTKSIEGSPSIVMTNSRWTAEIIRRTYGVEPAVVYPPVDVDYFRYGGEKKDKVIVTISRLSPEKNLHLIPRIASRLPGYTWYIVGSMGTGVEKRASESILNKISSEIKRSGAHNVQVLPDLPRSELRKLLLSASFYVHPYFPEHFGIAVAEAMAAGAIPIVYRDGGAWTDIVSRVDERLGYSDIEEVSRIIESLENNTDLVNYLRVKAIARVQEFKPEIFRKKFIGALIQANLI